MKIKVFAFILFVSALANFTSGEIIRGINIDFVTIGNPGNVADIAGCGWYGYLSPSGAVGYNYRIVTKEITADQWQTINAVARIDDTIFWSGNQPVAGVSWYSAARFCNYLTTGNTEDGVYKFSNGSLAYIMDHELAGSTYGKAYCLPTEDEWFKAAYYKPDNSGYSLYANGTNTAPLTSNTCYNIYSSPWDVGNGTQEQNGTFDMMGNVWEWCETNYDTYRIIRGGAFTSNEVLNPDFDALWNLSSYRQNATEPEGESELRGFRIAEIPEPTTLILLTLGGLVLRRKK